MPGNPINETVLSTAPVMVLGPLSDPRVTHLSRDQVLTMFGIYWTTLNAWKFERGFSRPVRVLEISRGFFVYPRAEIEAWKASSDAPAWLHGRMEKPKSSKPPHKWAVKHSEMAASATAAAA